MKAQSAKDALQTLMAQPNVNEVAERLAEEILKQIETDDEKPLRKGRQIIRTFLENPEIADEMLMDLCGWSMNSLLIFAELIPDDEGLLN